MENVFVVYPNPEFRIPLTIGIRHPSSSDNESWILVPGIWNSQRGADCLRLPYMGLAKHNNIIAFSNSKHEKINFFHATQKNR